MAARSSMSGVVGLLWQQFKSPAEDILENEENDQENEKLVNSADKYKSNIISKNRSALGNKILSTLNNGVNNTGIAIHKSVLKRATSVKSALNSLKQKMKVSTRQKKRLVTTAPTPIKIDLNSITPQRRSSRLMQKSEVKMYSPFEIDSPAIRAPLRPKMGTIEKRHARYLWSSPESIKAGIYNMTNDMQALANLSDDWSTPASNQKAKRSNVRTTPRCSRNLRSKKPLFI